ncbi:sigma-70 family RNA polymerase sigma factor [Nitriliruptor alkaliphilus]|uniref:sigma-70 family RNA polymerase sigma factor n=1 Tax=Nitriliruptor alkaliphilus TaxID=427918 RepID=UPI000695BD21
MPEELDRIFRAEFGQAVATLIRVFGDIDLAEDAVQEAFVVAARTWPSRGLPPNPGGWITTTARRRAIDRLRREAQRDDRQAQAALLQEQTTGREEVGPVSDDQLRLIFTCCHPALAVETRVALTLRLLGGLTTAEIARAFLVSDSAMEQRLVRAKRKIRATHLPYRVPEEHELPERLRGVLAVVYLVFNEGYLPTAGGEVARADLCTEAIRLARLLAALMPDEPEVLGLLALLLLTEARRRARASAGALVTLPDQDRSRWDRELIAEGQELVRRCLRRNTPGPYQLQAAINAVHSDAPAWEATDWRQILTLYDQLAALARSPVVTLNRAVAVAEVEGPEAALAQLEGLALERSHLLHATRADLLGRLGRHDAAAAAYRRARELTDNEAERRFIDDQLDDLGPPGHTP